MGLTQTKYCTRCVTPSTRPRVTFNADGLCNACQWHDKKQTVVDWEFKRHQLEELCARYRWKDGGFDCIVPCSGGKDGSYVAWKLKHNYNMHPLCITFKPQLQTAIGRINLENFINSGFDHVTISPNLATYRLAAKKYFIEDGMPNQPFVTGISTALLQYAIKFDIGLIMYGECGEIEYGGESKPVHKFNRDWLIDKYYEGVEPKEGGWWDLPSQRSLDSLHATWWSLYEDFDFEHDARFAKEKTGLQMMVGGSIGTFSNYAQLDSAMQDLHTFMMFVKFGFGRCTSDASIEIRRGRMTRVEGVKVVNAIDGQFPVEYLSLYLDYFEMTSDEFWGVIDSHLNVERLRHTGRLEKPFELMVPCK